MKDHDDKFQAIYDNASYLDEVYRNSLEAYFESSKGTNVWKLQNFPKYVPRQALTRFIVRYEIFKRVLNIQGSVVEIGVLDGASLMTWANLSAILEHLNYQRRILGFDVFGDFPVPTEMDKTGNVYEMYENRQMSLDSYDDIQRSIDLYDKNRFLGSIPKVELVKGNVVETVPAFLESRPETIVSLLYLDVNLFEPTKIALDSFVPRMPKGAVIVFDEINDQGIPGESIALLQSLNINKLRIERFTFDTKISFAVID